MIQMVKKESVNWYCRGGQGDGWRDKRKISDQKVQMVFESFTWRDSDIENVLWNRWYVVAWKYVQLSAPQQRSINFQLGDGRKVDVLEQKSN